MEIFAIGLLALFFLNRSNGASVGGSADLGKTNGNNFNTNGANPGTGTPTTNGPDVAATIGAVATFGTSLLSYLNPPKQTSKESEAFSTFGGKDPLGLL